MRTIALFAAVALFICQSAHADFLDPTADQPAHADFISTADLSNCTSAEIETIAKNEATQFFQAIYKTGQLGSADAMGIADGGAGRHNLRNEYKKDLYTNTFGNTVIQLCLDQIK